jgi:hypothetical protein
MRRHYCSADTRGGVQLVRQRSDAACIQGRTWGIDRGGVWVDRGCRADFAVGANNYGYGGYPNGGYGYPNGGYGGYPSSGGYGGYGSGYGQTFSCSSDDMRRHYCGVDTSGGVQIVRQRSDASCIQGRTWGYDRRGVWVDRGCRADFTTGGGGYNNRRNRDYGYGNGGYGNGGYGNGGYGTNRRRGGWWPW